MKDNLSKISRYSGWSAGSLRFLFPHAGHAKSFLAFEALKLIQKYKDNATLSESVLKDKSLRSSTRTRIQASVDADRKQAELLADLLEFLKFQEIGMDEYISYSQHSPGVSALTPNFDNLFRDWCWGEEEIQAYTRQLKKVLPSGDNFERTLSLGVGGGRLAYEFHRETQSAYSCFVDFNPLLLKMAQVMIQGKEVKLFEAPTIPEKLSEYKVERALKNPLGPDKKIDFVVADARTLFLKEQSFSCVFTPWLIDAVEMDLSDFVNIINYHLSPGGHWVSCGPLHFDKKGIESHYLVDEVIEISRKAGFELVQTESDFVPYMKSPEAGSYRVERVHAFNFKKVEDSECQDFDPLQLEPQWLKNPDVPIQVPIETLKLSAGYKTNAMVLEKVDGKKSLSEIAREISSQLGAEEVQVRYLVAQIIKNALFIAKQQVK